MSIASSNTFTSGIKFFYRCYNIICISIFLTLKKKIFVSNMKILMQKKKKFFLLINNKTLFFIVEALKDVENETQSDEEN